jgi:hypothetical protein
MCPACIGSLALGLGGLASAGGIAAALARRLRGRRRRGRPLCNRMPKETTS